MAALGFLPDEPHVLCNGCGIRKSCCTKRGDLAQWVLKWGYRPKDEWHAMIVGAIFDVLLKRFPLRHGGEV